MCVDADNGTQFFTDRTSDDILPHWAACLIYCILYVTFSSFQFVLSMCPEKQPYPTNGRTAIIQRFDWHSTVRFLIALFLTGRENIVNRSRTPNNDIQRTMIKLLRCSVLVLLCHIAQGLDVELEGITCDESLQVTADLYMQCSGGGRCTFGGNSTTLSGTSKF